MEAMLAGVKWVTARRALYFYLSRPGQLTRSRKIGDGLIASAEALARDPRISGNAELARAFGDRLERIRAAQWVGLLADEVKGRRWLGAAGMAFRSPGRVVDAFAAFRRRLKIAGLLRRDAGAAG
jgi:hypothetical protein